MEQLAKDSTSASLKITSTEAPAIVGSSAWEFSLGINLFHASTDEGLFSSSLPVLPHEKLNFSDAESYGQSFDDSSPSVNKLHLDDSGNDFLEESFLPDDEDELLAGIADDFDLSGLPSKLEDMGEYDVFGSGGGMELDSDPQDGLNIGLAKIKLSDGYVGNETGHYGLPNGMGTVTGEHPYGEHPSRTLFVRNINSNVEDSELKALFEQYGDIRTLYTACKHRGFVMISYYDIRDARAAMRTLQNKPLRRRKLDIHFSIPKDNPSEKDINQGTLVVFNLDPSVSNDDLRQIFGAYGEIKEIRETPHKRHHKFIEFYDVRAAEAALKALNRSDIAGKRIKLEPSRPGGARRSLMQQLTQELEHDDGRSFRHSVGSPVANSPPGNWTKFGSPLEKNLLQSFSQSQDLGARSSNHMPGLASILTPHASSSVKVPSSGKDQEFTDFTPTSRAPCQYSHSLPQQKSCVAPGPVSYSRELNSNASAVGSLTGPQFLWGSPAYSDHAKSSAWPASSPGHQIASSGRGQGFPYSSSHSSSFLGSYPHYHVGSAPSGVPFDRQLSYLSESPEPTFIPVAYGGMGLSHSGRNYLRNTGSHANINAGVAFPGHGEENCSPVLRMMSLPRHGSMFLGNGSFPGQRVSNIEGFSERSRHRMENNGSQTDGKNQYQLNLDKISSGEDTRTTLMIKNIPNKYTSKMLLAAIDENHGGAYDFVYLPIDFKNKCNVGYAFINMVSPLHIISFYEAFNGKKWEKFNSEKVASLAYARIQGKAALVAHFQNSSLMNEDKRCRPILFHSESLETHDQEEPLATGNLNVCIRQPDGSYSGDSLDCPMGNLDEIPKKDQLRT